ncbi:hypothetical protein [Adhaeribacter aquaticus]|uniref:hypothetical protein n=1 Tax=Adhaeribacter aquaticus TaxID=299567 RepID=UPI0003FA7D76|nr:hypothetical protein [Adhaeribacter aquaticus]
MRRSLPISLLVFLLLGILLAYSCQEKEQPGTATIMTEAIIDIEPTAAKVPVTLTVLGSFIITQKGVCYSTSPNPTISDLKTTEGSENGSFRSVLTGLTPDTRYYVRAYFLDNAGTPTYGNELLFTTAKEQPLTIATEQVTNITETTANSGGVITRRNNETIIAKGVAWSTSPNPTIAEFKTNDGTSADAFTSILTDLIPNTTYYVRAYATTNTGTAYGNQVSFKTLPPVNLTVNTALATNLTPTSATTGGTISGVGTERVASRGIVWGTTTNPTLNNNRVTSGTGLGSFVSIIENLIPNTTYYVRAFATLDNGQTFYGSEVSFTTPPLFLATITTANATNITATSAVSGGTVTLTSGTIAEAGLVWNKEGTPTIFNNKITNGNASGSFTRTISDLEPRTTYHVRAYATSITGITLYGNEIVFTTDSHLEVTLTTKQATAITPTSAQTGGTLTTTGSGSITAKGVVYSTSPQPTIADSRTSDGSGSGEFTSSLSGLASSTTYYIRAYATTSAGTTFYGNQVSFTTLETGNGGGGQSGNKDEDTDEEEDTETDNLTPLR